MLAEFASWVWGSVNWEIVGQISSAVAALAALFTVMQAARQQRDAHLQWKTERSSDAYCRAVLEPAMRASDRFIEDATALLSDQLDGVSGAQSAAREQAVRNFLDQFKSECFLPLRSRLKRALASWHAPLPEDDMAKETEAIEDAIVIALDGDPAHLKAQPLIEQLNDRMAAVYRLLDQEDPAQKEPLQVAPGRVVVRKAR